MDFQGGRYYRSSLTGVAPHQKQLVMCRNRSNKNKQFRCEGQVRFEAKVVKGQVEICTNKMVEYTPHSPWCVFHTTNSKLAKLAKTNASQRMSRESIPNPELIIKFPVKKAVHENSSSDVPTIRVRGRPRKESRMRDHREILQDDHSDEPSNESPDKRSNEPSADHSAVCSADLSANHSPDNSAKPSADHSPDTSVEPSANHSADCSAQPSNDSVVTEKHLVGSKNALVHLEKLNGLLQELIDHPPDHETRRNCKKTFAECEMKFEQLSKSFVKTVNFLGARYRIESSDSFVFNTNLLRVCLLTCKNRHPSRGAENRCDAFLIFESNTDGEASDPRIRLDKFIMFHSHSDSCDYSNTNSILEEFFARTKENRTDSDDGRPIESNTGSSDDPRAIELNPTSSDDHRLFESNWAQQATSNPFYPSTVMVLPIGNNWPGVHLTTPSSFATVPMIDWKPEFPNPTYGLPLSQCLKRRCLNAIDPKDFAPAKRRNSECELSRPGNQVHPFDFYDQPFELRNLPFYSRNPPVSSRSSPVDSKDSPGDSRNSSLDPKNPTLDQRSPPLVSRSPPVDSKNPPIHSTNPPLDQRSSPLDSRSPPLETNESVVLKSQPSYVVLD